MASCRTYPCIYKITNIINNKIYIGSCKIFSRRKAFHLFTLRNKTHCNKYLERSFHKYGEENFKFEIIEKVDNIDNLIKREQFYIDTLKPEYNSRIIADSNLCSKRLVTEIEKENTRERNKKFRKLSNDQVLQLQNLRNEGILIKDLSVKFNLEKSAISRILSGQWYKDLFKEPKIKSKKQSIPKKPTIEEVSIIKQLLINGNSIRSISLKLNISRYIITNIKNTL